jgi:hypothetical protein
MDSPAQFSIQRLVAGFALSFVAAACSENAVDGPPLAAPPDAASGVALPGLDDFKDVAVADANALAPDAADDTTTRPDLLPSNPPDASVADEADAAIDVASTPPDVASSPPDVQSAPPDVQSAPPDVQSAPPDVQSAPPDVQSAPPDVQSAPPDVQSAPPDVQSAPPDVQSAPPDVQSAPPDVQSAPPDVQSAPPDVQSAPPDVWVAPEDVWIASEDVGSTPDDVWIALDEVAELPEDILDLPEDIQDLADDIPDLPEDIPDVALDLVDAADAPDSSTEPPLPDFYDPDYLPHIELTVDATAMAVLTDTSVATQKTWVHAAFKCEGVTIADVGLRRKGSSTYRALPLKASLKIKFNKWIKGQKFRGYTDLTVDNMVDDATGLRERLSYFAYRQVGVPAPKCNTATISINGEAYGPYANVETPDGGMLKAWFGMKSKNLYEADSGGQWLPGSETGFTVDVGDATKADLIALFNDVGTAQNDNLLAGVQAHLDVMEWLRYCAVEGITAQQDNYGFGHDGSHNYFLAGDTDGVMHIMPWSTDLSMTEEGGGVDASQPIPAQGGPTLLNRCKMSQACWDAYKVQVAFVLDDWPQLDLASLAQKWHQQIDALMLADTKREASLIYYQGIVPLLYDWLDARPGVVKSELGMP